MNQLRRSRHNNMIAGVAGGMAEFFDVDVALVRLVWVMAFFAGGVGLLAYIVCWIVIPEGTAADNSYSSNNNDTDLGPDISGLSTNRRRNAGLLLIGLGLIILLKNLVPWHYWDKAWPLLLVALGLYILLGNRKGDQ